MGIIGEILSLWAKKLPNPNRHYSTHIKLKFAHSLLTFWCSYWHIKLIMETQQTKSLHCKHFYIKAGSQYDARTHFVLRHLRVDTHRNAMKHKDRLGSYPCIPLHCILASSRKKSQILNISCYASSTQRMHSCVISM